MIYRASTEQGFVVESNGETDCTIIDSDGLVLVRRQGTAPLGQKTG
jgi:hypothetical protein